MQTTELSRPHWHLESNLGHSDDKQKTYTCTIQAPMWVLIKELSVQGSGNVYPQLLCFKAEHVLGTCQKHIIGAVQMNTHDILLDTDKIWSVNYPIYTLLSSAWFLYL